MIKLWRFLSVPIVVAVCLGLMLVPVAVPGQGQVALASGNVTVAIEPATTSVATSTSFTIDAVVNNPDGNEVAMHAIRLNFDPTYFTVDSVDLVDFATDMAAPTIDNVAGIVDYDPNAGVGSSINNTTIISARINCTAKAIGGITTVSWVFEAGPPPRKTKVIYGTTDYLEDGNMSLMLNGTVIVGPAFNITVTSNGCCPITVGALGTVAANSSQAFTVPCPNITLTAGAGACCNLVNWTVNGTFASGNPIVVTGAVNTSHTATATCSVPQYNLTMNVTGSGTTTPAVGPHTYTCGQVVNVSATADPGWRFLDWTGDLTGSTNPTTITIDGDKNVTANFVERFTLTMAVTGSGTTTPSVGDHTYDNETVVGITAMPAACWDFVNWTGDVADPDSASTNVTMDANKTVIAHFAQVNHTLNVTVNGNGTVTINGTIPTSYPNSTSWVNCTVVNLIATPDPDWAFLGWTGNVSDVNSSATTINMTGNYSITAHFGAHDFEARPLSLTFTTVEGVNPSSKTLEICNTGNGTLNWSLSDGDTDWLSENPMSGSLNETGCEDVTVSVNVAGMPAGDYTAAINFTGSIGQKVPVSLHIAAVAEVEEELPEIIVLPAGLSASSFSISPQQVQPGQEVTISVNIANTGGVTGSYNAVLYINSAVEASQTVSVAAGISKNVIFTVSKTKAGVYDVSLAGQSGQFEVVGGGGWFGGGGLGTGGIIAIVVIVIILIGAVVFILRGTTKPE